MLLYVQLEEAPRVELGLNAAQHVRRIARNNRKVWHILEEELLAKVVKSYKRDSNVPW